MNRKRSAGGHFPKTLDWGQILLSDRLFRQRFVAVMAAVTFSREALLGGGRERQRKRKKGGEDYKWKHKYVCKCVRACKHARVCVGVCDFHNIIYTGFAQRVSETIFF